MNKAIKYLFGQSGHIPNPLKNRRTIINFPSLDEDDKERIISYSSADGIVLYLIKRIEKLEEKINKNK